jgi:DNA repair exonuclease SbcCD ATPase subunit
MPAAGVDPVLRLIWNQLSNSNCSDFSRRSEEFTMWLLFVFAWLGLLAAIAIVAQQAFGYDLSRIWAHFLELPPGQRLAAAVIVVLALVLIGVSIFLSRRMSRQEDNLRLLRTRLKMARDDMVVAHGLQNHFGEVVQHLVDSNPQEALASLQKRLTETEQKVALQQSQDVATDIQEQLDDIRRRQQALRETVGEVAEKRRVTEPVFAEIKDRQRQLERSLSKLEVDDNKHNLADRLQEIGMEVLAIQKRLAVLQESLVTLNRFKDDLDKTNAELGPLQAQGVGIYAVIDELRPAYETLSKRIDEFELKDGETISSHVEALSRSKMEIEQKVARLDDCFHILETVGLDFGELRQRQAHLERSIADVETDASGKSLVDRQNALNEFILQARLRLSTLESSFTTLNRFKEELTKAQADLVPLQAPEFGIESLIGEVHTVREIVLKTLSEIEASGDDSLGSRLERLSSSKHEIDERLAQVFEHFSKLDSIRKDIGGIFMSIRSALMKVG